MAGKNGTSKIKVIDDGIINLDALVPSKITKIRLGGKVYSVVHPLDLTLLQAAQTEAAARTINTAQAKIKEGNATEEEVDAYDKALTDFVEIVTDAPREVLAETNWWKRLAIINAFSTQRQEATGDETPLPIPNPIMGT